MNDIVTTLTTVASFSDDGLQRYLLRKTWDPSLPRLAIIMYAPGEASGIALDYTTLLVLNNAARLGFGSVDILNLFAQRNNFSLLQALGTNTENQEAILQSAQVSDTNDYAPGLGKSKNKIFQKRQQHILELLLPYESKLHCLSNKNGKGRLQHPLSPTVREWKLSPLKIAELLPEMQSTEEPSKKAKGRPPKTTQKVP